MSGPQRSSTVQRNRRSRALRLKQLGCCRREVQIVVPKVAGSAQQRLRRVGRGWLTPTKGLERLRGYGDRPGGLRVADLEIKNVATPDETRPFVDKGRAAVVDVAGHPVLYGTFEPGWRWSEHLKPIAGTDSCQATHLLYCLSGRMRVETDSGEQGEIGPGDVAAIQPGHDAWTVGDEPCVTVDFGGYAQYARR